MHALCPCDDKVVHYSKGRPLFQHGSNLFQWSLIEHYKRTPFTGKPRISLSANGLAPSYSEQTLELCNAKIGIKNTFAS